MPPPSLPSTIHLRLPRARNVAPGHCGACSQSPSSSFHSGFYRIASIPQAVVWDLALKGQTEAPSSPQFLTLHFVPTPRRRWHCGGSRNPGVGAYGGSPSPVSPATQAVLCSGPNTPMVSVLLPTLQVIRPLTIFPIHLPHKPRLLVELTPGFSLAVAN